MLTRTPYHIELGLIKQAVAQLPTMDVRLAINQPTGDFFYDPWELKSEFKGTAWETIYNSLPFPVGEARTILLQSAQCYACHADIDDRYHLNLAGEKSYLIDLESNVMHKTERDGQWFEMDAGKLHTAINFSNVPRFQLVVRKLLMRPAETSNFVHVQITSNITKLEDARYEFDNTISVFLNRINKQELMNNFNYSVELVTFDIHNRCLEELTKLAGEHFSVKLIN
jgi:hypothetical protein